MKLFKKVWTWQKTLLQKSQTRLVIGMLGGFLIGVGTDNLGLGIALAVAFGVPGYASGKKNKADDNVDGNKK